MLLFFAVIAILVLSGFITYGWYAGSVKSAARARLFDSGEKEIPAARFSRSKRMITRYDWIAAVFGVLAGIVLIFFVKPVYAGAFAFILGMIAWQLHEIWVSRKISQMEEQLADLIDLMTSGLQAGSGAVAALESALSEIGNPLGPPMRDVLGRLRMGDGPQEVFEALAERTPLETIKIFSVTMAVHWETGGRLVPLLTTVSKTIRDRIEVMRNARLQSVQGRISAIVFVAVSYLLAYAVWQYDPSVMESFVVSREGSAMMSFLIVLQALGMFWIHRMTQLRY